MRAVDQAGDEVARYRLAGGLRVFVAQTLEIAVRPGQPLTDSWPEPASLDLTPVGYPALRIVASAARS
jgi:hypothetical protein